MVPGPQRLEPAAVKQRLYQKENSSPFSYKSAESSYAQAATPTATDLIGQWKHVGTVYKGVPEFYIKEIGFFDPQGLKNEDCSLQGLTFDNLTDYFGNVTLNATFLNHFTQNLSVGPRAVESKLKPGRQALRLKKMIFLQLTKNVRSRA